MIGRKDVFVTGASGCVGHYLVERLMANSGWRVHVLLRDPSRLRADLRERVEVLQGDLCRPESFEPLLGEMDAAVLAHASWGGEDSRAVNVEATRRILDGLDPARARRAVYLSTASLLGPDGPRLAAARRHGTSYIRHKGEALEDLGRTRCGDRVVTLYPTVILGGDERHPVSPALRGFRQALPHIGVLRFLSLDARFHVVHASDVARAAVHFLDHDPQGGPLVLGIAPLDAGEALARAARMLGYGPAPQLDLTPLALALPAILPHKFSSWDRYCLRHRDFGLPVLDLAALLGPSGFESLEGILAAEVSPCAPSPC